MNSEQELPQNSHATDISYKIGLLFLSALFLIFPYWNGLFFDPSFSNAAIYFFLTLIVLSICWLRKGIKITGWALVDYLAFGYVLSYIISAIHPANYELSIIGVFRNISYLGSYLLVRVLLGGGLSRVHILKMLSFSGALVATYGFAAGFGTIQRAGAVQAGRLSSVFEYPNSAAAYLMVIFILTISLIVIEKRKLQKIIYAAISFIMIGFIIYSYSRGVWLALGVTVLLAIVVSPKQYKLFSFVYSLLPILALLLTSKWIGNAIAAQQQLIGWVALLAGIVLVSGLALIVELILNRISFKVNKNLKWLGLILVAIAVIALVLFWDKLLPQSIVGRLTSINLQDFSAVQRFVFFRDAFSAFLSHPIFGNGYGTWVSSYQSFQMYPYNSKQSHGYLFDVLLDVGALGFLLLIGWLICAARLWWRNYNATSLREDRLMLSSIVVSFAALFGHSLIDFNMSYGVMNFLLWTLIALLVGPLTVTTPNQIAAALNRRRSSVSKGLLYSVTIGSLIGLIVMAGYTASEQVIKSVSGSGVDPNLAKEKVETGIVFAPYRSSLWIQKAKVLDFLYDVKSNDKSKSEQINKASITATDLAPYDFKTAMQAASYTAKHGDGLKALSLYQQSWKNGKFSMQALELYLRNSDSAGAQFYTKNKQESKRQFENALNAYNDAENKVQNFSSLPTTLRLEFPYQITPVMRLNAAESAYYLGKYDEVMRIVTPIINGTDKAAEDAIDKAKLLVSAANVKNGKSGNDEQVIRITKKKQENAQFLEYISKINKL